MSTAHPLNQAVINQALQDLRNGQLRRCLAMGFAERDLDALKHPELVSLLVNARVPWCTVTVNRDVLRRLLQQVRQVEQEVATIDRLLRGGASTELVSQFYGLTHQEVALRRAVLGLPKRKGRHRVLSEAQEIELWHRWQPELQRRQQPLDDTQGLLLMTLDVAQAMALPLSVVWAAVQQWIEQGLVSG